MKARAHVVPAPPPPLPARPAQVRELMQQSLRRQAQSLAASKHVRLAWDDAVVEWLVSKVSALLMAGRAAQGPNSPGWGRWSA